jgi:hypothetical protein
MTSESDFLTSLRLQSIDVAVDVLAGIQRAKDARSYARGPLAPEDVKAPSRDKPISGDLLFELARMQVEQLKLLLKYNQASSGRLVDRLRDAMGMVSPRAPAAPAREIVFRGKLGEQVTRKFIVENSSSSAAAPAFAVTQATSESGRRFHLPDVEFVADPLKLEPRGEGVVTMTITLTGTDLRPRETYVAEVHARIESWIVMTAPIRIEVLSEEGAHGAE